MDEVYVKICGRASADALEEIGVRDKAVNECYLFLDYAGFTIPNGHHFCLLMEICEGKKVYNIKAQVKKVAQRWAKPFDGIPKGYKTIASFELDEPSLKLVESKIPEVSNWEMLHAQFVLSNEKYIRI